MWCLIPFFIKPLGTSANHSHNFPSAQVDLPDSVIFCIAHVHKVLAIPGNVAQSLRIMELSFSKGPVDQANFRRADDPRALECLFID